MPYIEPFPECCGIDVIAGFPQPSFSCKIDGFKDSVEAFLKRVKSGEERISDEWSDAEFEQAYPGCYICSLYHEQVPTFEPLLKEVGFRIIMRGIVNPKTGNKVTLYGMKFKPTKKMKKEYFPDEDTDPFW